MHRVDYDKIAQLYDEPQRDHTVDSHLLDFLEHCGVPGVRVLDIGCGTGQQLAANERRLPGVTMVGLDRFAGMLRIARNRCSEVQWIQADGARLPLQPGTFHFIVSQFSYPHVRNTRQLLSEIYVTLAPGGRFVMTNIDPWAMPAWIIYRYFPEALELDQADFMQVEAFAGAMREIGFEGVRVAREDRSSDESVSAFRRFAGARHRASQLMAVSDSAYAEGLARIDKDLARAGAQDLVVKSAFELVTIAGDRPPDTPWQPAAVT